MYTRNAIKARAYIGDFVLYVYSLRGLYRVDVLFYLFSLRFGTRVNFPLIFLKRYIVRHLFRLGMLYKHCDNLS